MFCAQCEAPLRASAKVCIQCGTSVFSEGSAAAGAQSVAPTRVVSAEPTLIVESTTETGHIRPRATVAPSADQDASSVAKPVPLAPEPSKIGVGKLLALFGVALFMLASVAVVMLGKPSEKAVESAVKTNSQTSMPVVTPTDPPPSAPVADSRVVTATPPAPVPAEASRTADTEAISKQQTVVPTSGTVSVNDLSELLRKASMDDWSAIDQKVRSFLTVSYPIGDRKTAREANRLGLELIQMGQYSDAAAAFKRGLDLSPGDIELRNNLAFSTLRTGRYEQAGPMLAETLLSDPTRTSAWGNLAELFAETGNAPSARAAVKLAVHFSRNQQKTMEYLLSAEKVESEKLRGVISLLAPELEQIPPFLR